MDLSRVDHVGRVGRGAWRLDVRRRGSAPMLWGLAVQTALLGLVASVHRQRAPRAALSAPGGVVIAVKAVVIPAFLAWIAGRIEVPARQRHGAEPISGASRRMRSAGRGLFLRESGRGRSRRTRAAGMALALLLIGMLLMLTRRLAISQVVGFLVLENGIFLYALTQTHGMPLMVEMGVVLRRAGRGDGGGAGHLPPQPQLRAHRRDQTDEG